MTTHHWDDGTLVTRAGVEVPETIDGVLEYARAVEAEPHNGYQCRGLAGDIVDMLEHLLGVSA